MEKELVFSELNAVYGGLLTQKQREVIELYYSCDLSLAEISEIKGISRNGALDNLEQAKKNLMKYESVLKLLEKRKKLSLLAESVSDDKLKRTLNDILGD